DVVVHRLDGLGHPATARSLVRKCRLRFYSAFQVTTGITNALVVNRGLGSYRDEGVGGVATTRLYLVRHGATQLSVEDRFAGDIGADLSADGRSQAERLAVRVRDHSISAIYSSPLSRAIETARIIATGCGLE